jgi:TolB protein
MKYCPECGFENPTDANFCGNCNHDFSKYNNNKSHSGGAARKIRTFLIITLIFLIVGFLFLFINSNFESDIRFLKAIQIEFLKTDFSGITLPNWLPLPDTVRSYFDDEIVNNINEAIEDEEINLIIDLGDESKIDESQVEAAVQDDTPLITDDMVTDNFNESVPNGELSSSANPQGQIVFTCQVDRKTNHDQICIMNADGSGWQQLTNDLKYEHYYSSLSFDGSEIVFSSSRAGGFEIFMMNSDGSNLRRLTSGMGEFYAPALSPDSTKIIATRHTGGKNYITLLNRDGGFIRDLNSYFDCKDPVWSPDGSEILFAADPKKTGIQFFVMNTDGSNVRQITDMGGLRGRSDWGVDGMMASYTGEYSKHNRELFLFGKENAPLLITDGGDNLAPSFSPDGKWITFMSYRDNFWDPDGCEIYIMRLEDGFTERLTDNNYCDYQPRWSK